MVQFVFAISDYTGFDFKSNKINDRYHMLLEFYEKSYGFNNSGRWLQGNKVNFLQTLPVSVEVQLMGFFVSRSRSR